MTYVYLQELQSIVRKDEEVKGFLFQNKTLFNLYLFHIVLAEAQL